MTMRDTSLQDIRAGLMAALDALATQEEATRDSREAVAHDQQSVGRLSRMDALQQQAMANATQARRRQAEARIRAAIARIDEGEFGYCTSCGEEIAPARLALDPAAALCIGCASA